MLFKKVVFSAVAFAALSLYGTVAFAFDQNAVVNVSDKKSDYYTSQGGRVGSLIVRPSLEITQLYDNNIFRQSSNEIEDLITQVNPELDIETDWNLHKLSAGAKADLGRFSNNSDEDYDDHSYYVSARYDMDYGTYLSVDLRTEYHHEDRGSLDDVGGDKPIEYNVSTSTFGFTRELGIVNLYLTGSLRSYSYDDSLSGGSVVNNSSRDRNQKILRGKLSYSFGSDYSLFVQTQYERRRYDLASSSFRNSDGYDYRLGVDANLTGEAQGRLYVGYSSKEYNEDVFDDVDAINYGGSLLWNIGEITSLNLSLDRAVLETTLSGSSSLVNTKGALSIERAVRENIILGMSAGFSDDKYEGSSSSSSRDNITYNLGTGVDYKLNDVLQAGVDYDYLKRNFKSSSGDYDNHKVLFSIKYEY